jgi:thioester reductase-like protein
VEIFLTGATGHLGGELLVTLAKARMVDRIHCLVRARGDVDVESRLQAVFDLHGDARDRDRVLAIKGDLFDPFLAAKLAADPRLSRVSVVVHTAADTSFFPMYARRIRETNIAGLGRLLEWAGRHSALRTFVYVGTAMICGADAPSGRVLESDPPQSVAQIVEYTRSKLEAELALRRALPPDKLLVVRPSIIVADSRGLVPRSRDVLWAVAALNHLRLVPLMAASSLDMIPVDYAANAIAALALAEPALRRHRLYHVTAGPERATSPGQLAAALEPHFPQLPAFYFGAEPGMAQLRRWVKARAVPAAPWREYLEHWRRSLGEPRKILTVLASLQPYAEFAELGYTFVADRLAETTGLRLSEPAHVFIPRSVQHIASLDLLHHAVDP